MRIPLRRKKRDAKKKEVLHAKMKARQKRRSSATVTAHTKTTRKSEVGIAEQAVKAEGLGHYSSVLKWIPERLPEL